VSSVLRLIERILRGPGGPLWLAWLSGWWLGGIFEDVANHPDPWQANVVFFVLGIYAAVLARRPQKDGTQDRPPGGQKLAS